MKKICGIYKITSPSEKIYIGQSINCTGRFSSYKKGHCHTQRILYRSILKYGWDSHRFEIIEECSQEELNNKEIYWANFYKVYNRNNGLNIRFAGSRGKNSEETKKLISVMTKKALASPEMRKKLSNIQRNKSEETKKNHSIGIKKSWDEGKMQGFTNKHHSEKSKEKIRIKMTDRIVSESTCKKIREIKKQQSKNPDYINKIRESNIKAWANPVLRKTNGDLIRKALSNPETKKKQSEAIKKSLRVPGVLEKRNESMRKTMSNPEWKIMISKIRKEVCNRPEVREKRSISQRKRRIREKQLNNI